MDKRKNEITDLMLKKCLTLEKNEDFIECLDEMGKNSIEET